MRQRRSVGRRHHFRLWTTICAIHILHARVDSTSRRVSEQTAEKKKAARLINAPLNFSAFDQTPRRPLICANALHKRFAIATARVD